MLVEVVYGGGGKGETVCTCVDEELIISQRAIVVLVTPVVVASSWSSQNIHILSNSTWAFLRALSIWTIFHSSFAIDCVVCKCYSSAVFKFYLYRTCYSRVVVYLFCRLFLIRSIKGIGFCFFDVNLWPQHMR